VRRFLAAGLPADLPDENPFKVRAGRTDDLDPFADMSFSEIADDRPAWACVNFIRAECDIVAAARTDRKPASRSASEKGHPMSQTGTVKFFNSSKGFGFVTPEGGAKDVFLHVTALERAGMSSIEDGAKITFDVEPDTRGKGPKAVNVQRA
jgi:CspA family cold shock protein